MRFRRTRGWAGAGGSLDREHSAISCDATQTRQHIEQSSHVGGLFLYPDDVARVWMTLEFCGEFGFREWIELLDECDCG